MGAGVKHLSEAQCPHLSSHYRISNTTINLFHVLNTDLSLIPARSAAKSYITSWCIQNLSKRALNRQPKDVVMTGHYTANVPKVMVQLCRVEKSRDASRDVTVAATAHTARQGQRHIYLNKTKLMLT